MEESEENCRFVVQKGVDESLDAKKRVHNGLPDLLHELAMEEVETLPECMRSCTMLYVPQIGRVRHQLVQTMNLPIGGAV